MSSNTMTDGADPDASSPAMIDRRSLLGAGVCAAAAAALAPTPMVRGLFQPANAGPIAFHKVLFDRQHPAAVAFGRAGAAAGLPVESIGQDLTALWRELSGRWRETPVAIAGLTDETTATYLQHLAQDAGLRLVLRASHTPLGDGRVRHYLTGTPAALQHAALLDEGERWPVGSLALLRASSADFATKTMERISPSGGSRFSQERLVSWAMAPISRSRPGRPV